MPGEDAPWLQRLQSNLQSARQRMVDAARRAGRDPDAIRMVAVTKGHPPEAIRALYDIGVRAMGENRIQEAIPKTAELPSDIEWHLIGHLQRNKAKAALQHFRMIHSVDSIRLGRELEKQAERLGVFLPVLFEVNVSGEETKYGFKPEEVGAALSEARNWPHLTIAGLMTMAPYEAAPDDTRPVFRGLRQLRDELRRASGNPAALPELSMGMTNDFEVAIEEGATIVRIGGALFAP